MAFFKPCLVVCLIERFQEEDLFIIRLLQL